MRVEEKKNSPCLEGPHERHVFRRELGCVERRKAKEGSEELRIWRDIWKSPQCVPHPRLNHSACIFPIPVLTTLG